MDGYTTSYVNLIADNLRDRYENGFPILKELIQNADDAKARTFIFGRHVGFPNASHPLLQGPGLWFFNDGEFKQSDAHDLRSFGITSKAGDNSPIGKFGLGMKSVFHLCEALFYVAWDGKDLHREGLTPWKRDDHWPHPEWDETRNADWEYLTALGKRIAAQERLTWFLLWLPLRMRKHLQVASGQESGAIISRFPGDDPSGELAFLNDMTLAQNVAEMLPLLKHLERVQHQGQENPFSLRLTGALRLMDDPPCTDVSGQVLQEDGSPLLTFSGNRVANPDVSSRFADMKVREEWPRTWYRDELGREHQAEDKTSPEAAVVFCSSAATRTRSRLHWAVFLPVEDGSEVLRVEHGQRGHSLVLHGQFFLDAGRKKIHGLEDLGRRPESLGEVSIDDSSLRRVWNQRLAQEVVLPLVLPTLERYATQQKLADDECSALTKALSDSRWFKTLDRHVCRDATWTRTFQSGEAPRWCLIRGDSRSRLRPVPTPPRTDPGRPFLVFPEMVNCDVTPYDCGAPGLGDAPTPWQEEELAVLLSRVDGLFKEATATDYLADFLDACAGPCLSKDDLQNRLLRTLTRSLRIAGSEARRQVATKARRLIGFVQPERRLTLATELPEPVLKGLWEIGAPVLLVPKGFEPDEPGRASPDQQALVDWLRELDHALDSMEGRRAQQAILQAVQGLLRTLPTETRGRLLRERGDLRIIAVRDARSGVEKPVSFDYLERLREEGTLFRFAEGLRGAEMGDAPLLARVLPGAEVCLVRTRTYRELFSDEDQDIPVATDGRSFLAAVGHHSGELGDHAARRELLGQANDPDQDPNAQRGLRLLLHGSIDHRTDDTAKLWIGRHHQHRAWSRLWGALNTGKQWSLIPEELADVLPRTRWTQARLMEIDARTLIDELSKIGQGIESPEEFPEEDREEILSNISNEDLWRRLPLHTTVDGVPVSAGSERTYLVRDGVRPNDPFVREAILIAPSGNVYVASQQRRWLRPLDDRATIEIAMGTAEPSHHWRIIMDAFGAIRKDDIDDHLRAVLRSTTWLPAIGPEPVKPEDVIDLQGSLGDEVHRLVAYHRAAHGFCFAVPAEIDGAVREHEAWQRLREEGFSSRIEGIERLGLLLEDVQEYRVGIWPTQPQSEVVALLAGHKDLPGWRLLETAAEPFDPDTVWAKLGPALSKEIDVQRLKHVLGWLSGNQDQWSLRKSIHDAYLGQLAGYGEAATAVIPCLHLASATERWRDAAELCVDAHGVVGERLLDRRQAAILGNLVVRSGTGAGNGQTGTLPVFPKPEFQVVRDTTPTSLGDFFQEWNSGVVPTPMIGCLLALLGPDLRDLAKEYLRPHSLDWLVEQLPWSDPGRIPERWEWMGGNTVDQALELIQAGVKVETGEDVAVLNLLGEPMRVALEQEPRTLLAGALSWQGGYGVMIPLRRIEPRSLQAEWPSRLLRATAERLYEDLYNQPTADFGALWQELDRSDQLEIGVARRLILDHLPFYLRQLSVKCEGIENQLSICDSARRRIAEAEAGGQSSESDGQELRQALEDLANRIDGRADEQHVVVQAVKSRLEQYQYGLSSIPLEVFQNADDAAIELGQFYANSSVGCDVPLAARRFVVDEREDGLGFLHWGRLINARGPVGFDGERRGYDRDLEKMLILSATDKRGDQGVTGKFGLGFKSALLACEQPRILSGRLAIRVVAGILPEPWEDEDANAAKERLFALGTDSKLPGTLIDLPGIRGELRNEVLGRFRRLAGILCVFGRAVRSITAEESNWCWQPRVICPGVEVGDLDLKGDWGARTTALCVRTDSGSLLMALGPQGFRQLPDEVPALWVTAPTSESRTVGFAINGNFDLDAGRGRLAGNTTKNIEMANQIGREVGDALGALLERSRRDWDSVRTDLGLAADFVALDFWESIWLGLAKGCLRPGYSDGTDLARQVMLGALARLSARMGSVPNGLPGPLRDFVDAGEVRYELSGVLLREEVATKLGAWARFTDRYPEQICVSKEIGDILRQADLSHPQTLGLSALVGLLDHSRTEPADAEVLGRLQLLTEDTSDWSSDDLQGRLSKLLFRSEADEWVDTRNLLALHGGGLDGEEPRRHELAPPESRLHSDYYIETDGVWPAVVFFQVCRRRMEAPVEKLAQWIQNAHSVETKFTALKYLADGEIGERVAEQVRGKGWLRSALNVPVLMEGLTAEQVDRLRRRLASDDQIERAVTDYAQGSESGEGIIPGVGLPTALERLYDWWSGERHQQATAYRDRLYPWPLNYETDQETGRVELDHQSWFLLLALGSFQGMGRTREEQHRNFIRGCQERGWWETFTGSDPQEEPERWMTIIEEYAEAQYDDEEWAQWLAQFPKLYRLRRWLDDYVTLFLSIARFQEQFTLDAILAPRTNPHFQGGGIDAPPLTRTLKVGSHLVIRELLYHGVLQNPLAVPHAYAPISRVQEFFGTFGVSIETSEEIHQLLTEHLGEDRVTFGGDYDVPLRIISADDSLRRQLLA